MQYSTVGKGVLFQGDSEIVLSEQPEKSVDLVVTDPPYGYSFMGKDWDKAVPSVALWKSVLRVMKPGAFAFIMSAPRQDVFSRMIMNLEQAGFDLDYTSIYWTYASGFPKGTNVSKFLDKRAGVTRPLHPNPGGLRKGTGNTVRLCRGVQRDDNPISEEAKHYNGSFCGYQPKPAVEIIIVAMRPIEEKTFIDQCLANGKAITWLENCRIPYVNDADRENIKRVCQNNAKDQEGYRINGTGQAGDIYGKYKAIPDYTDFSSEKGRYAANLIVSDKVLDNGKETKSSRTASVGGFGVAKNTFGEADNLKVDYERGYDDSSEFSRLFSLDLWWENQLRNLPEDIRATFPFMIVPKPAQSERNAGCEAIEGYWVEGSTENKPQNRSANKRNNFHPTVKPVKLFAYLIALGSQPKDLILDPFIGSGTAAIAAELMDRNWWGVDLTEEYLKIAHNRVKAKNEILALPNMDELRKVKQDVYQRRLTDCI